MNTLFYSSMIAATVVSGAQLYGMEERYWDFFPGGGAVVSPSQSPQSTPGSSPSGSPRLGISSPYLRSGCLALRAIEIKVKENTEIAEEHKKSSKQ